MCNVAQSMELSMELVNTENHDPSNEGRFFVAEEISGLDDSINIALS